MAEITVALWHPFTARSVGWDDESLMPVLHSRPHVSALKHLQTDLNAKVRVEYLTDRRRPWTVEREGVQFQFWPRTRWVRRRSEQFRNEWSLQGLGRLLLRPADVTVINTSGHGGGFTRALARGLRARKRPYIAMIGGLHATLHGPQLDYYEQAASVVVHNSHLMRELISAGVKPERVRLLPLGVDTELFHPDPGIESRGERVVLYVGRVLESKGAHRLVDALPTIVAAVPDAQLHIVGPQSDARYSASLRTRIADLELDDHVRFFGPVPHEDLPAFYRRASVFVLPNDAEGFGMVLVESLACGTPVVALRGGGSDDIVEPGNTGLLVEAGELPRALAGLLADEGSRGRLSKLARVAAIERFSLKLSNDRMKSVVLAAANSGRGQVNSPVQPPR